jgi:hypothetical protein
MQQNYVKAFQFPSAPFCLFIQRRAHLCVCSGKCFGTVGVAVDWLRERKGIKVTVRELTLISRSLHKIQTAFPPSALKISRDCLAILAPKEELQ